MPSDPAVAARLAHICRHPIKSIGWEMLDKVALRPGRTLPWDRHWALAHEAARFDTDAPAWRPKRDFVRGVAAPPLMPVQARLSEDGSSLELTHPERPDLTIDPDNPADSAALTTWIAPLWPDSRPAPARVVSAGTDQALTDQERPLVSILSLASLRDMSDRLGQALSIHRLRGNLWIDDLPPWAEFDWVGQTISIGAARFEIVEPIERCLAINGSPETGTADAQFFEGLDREFGHSDFGVFARVTQGGTVALGDRAAPL